MVNLGGEEFNRDGRVNPGAETSLIGRSHGIACCPPFYTDWIGELRNALAQALYEFDNNAVEPPIHLRLKPRQDAQQTIQPSSNSYDKMPNITY
jgi:hypothetical protein